MSVDCTETVHVNHHSHQLESITSTRNLYIERKIKRTQGHGQRIIIYLIDIYRRKPCCFIILVLGRQGIVQRGCYISISQTVRPVMWWSADCFRTRYCWQLGAVDRSSRFHQLWIWSVVPKQENIWSSFRPKPWHGVNNLEGCHYLGRVGWNTNLVSAWVEFEAQWENSSTRLLHPSLKMEELED